MNTTSILKDRGILGDASGNTRDLGGPPPGNSSRASGLGFRVSGLGFGAQASRFGALSYSYYNTITGWGVHPRYTRVLKRGFSKIPYQQPTIKRSLICPKLG